MELKDNTFEDELLLILNATDVDVIDVLSNTALDAKETFLRDSSLPRPKNQYDRLDQNLIKENLRDLERAKEILMECGISESVKQVYRSILCQNWKQNQFALANARYNSSADEEERALAAKQHCQANIALYGPADEDIFWTILSAKLEQISAQILTGAKAEKRRELMSMIGPVKKAGHAFFTPGQETFEAFSKCMESFFERFFRHIPVDQHTFTAYNVCNITNEILSEELNVLGKGWKAVVNENGAYASTDTKKKEIIYPGKRSRGLYSHIEVKGILAHELGVHALRAMPFADHPVSALSHGLPGYETFEEGLATAVESSVMGKFRHPGFLHYVSIGLGTFLKKDFREVFEIQTRLEYLTDGANRSQCFDSVQRAFRGTGILPNNKDLIYLNGNVLVWRFIEDHINNERDLISQLFEIGKSDPMNKMHRNLCAGLSGRCTLTGGM